MTTSLRARTCRICEQEFSHPVRPGTQPAYCSDECRRRATWNRRQERRRGLAEARCSRCGDTKPISEFSGGTQSHCRPCHAAYARIARANKTPEQKERARRQDVAYRHNTTIEWLMALLKYQGDRCAICRTDLTEDSRQWHVDHDHNCCSGTNGNAPGRRQRGCGRCIRGILCGNCNGGLGLFRDNPNIVRAALDYLQHPVANSLLVAE